MGGCASRTAAGAPSPAADVQPTGRVSDRRASPKAHRRETLEARIERKSMESSGSANSISRRLSQVQPSPVVTQQRVLSDGSPKLGGGSARAMKVYVQTTGPLDSVSKHAGHAERLMKYVPRFLQKDFLETPVPFSQPVAVTAGGAVMFADLSGFTALAEKLAKKGPAGAEKLTDNINCVFDKIIEIISHFEGDVVKFAGDAILVIFVRETYEESVTEALKCALTLVNDKHALMVDNDLMQANNRNALLNIEQFTMHVGIGAGKVHKLIVGGVLDRWEVCCGGAPMKQLATAVSDAKGGEVCLSGAAFAHIADLTEEEQLVKLDNGNVKVKKFMDCGQRFGSQILAQDSMSRRSANKPKKDYDPAEIKALDSPEDLVKCLRVFVPGAIRNGLKDSSSNVEGAFCEMRSLSVVFCNFPKVDVEQGDTALQQVHQVVESFQTLCYLYEGSLNKCIVDDKGMLILGAFGLPPLSHEDDAMRSLRFSTSMTTRQKEDFEVVSIGVTTGTSFCGIIGNERRCEYTLIADCVNLAARLMGKAGEGAVMCDAKTKTLCERVSTRNARLSFKGPDMIKVKGKSKKIEVFKVFPKKNVSLADAHKMMHQKGQVRAHPFRGRAPMLKRFTREVEKFQGNKKGLTVVLEGPEGVGKTRMVDEILHETTRINMQWAMLTGDATKASYIQPIKSTAGECEVHLPFFAWKDIFSWITGLAGLELPDDDASANADALAGTRHRMLSRGKSRKGSRHGSLAGFYSTVSGGPGGLRKRGSVQSIKSLLSPINSPTKEEKKTLWTSANDGNDEKAGGEKGKNAGQGGGDSHKEVELEGEKKTKETIPFRSPKDARLPRSVSSLKKKGMSRSARVLSSQSSASTRASLDPVLLASASRINSGLQEQLLTVNTAANSQSSARASMRMTISGSHNSKEKSFRTRSQMAAEDDPIYAREMRERAQRTRQFYAAALMKVFTSYDAEKFPFVDSPTYWVDNASLISSVVQVSLGQDEKCRALEGSSEFNSLQLNFLYNLLRARATKNPLMIVIDNAQWLDQASLGLVSKLAREPIPKLMLVLAIRPIVKRGGLARSNSMQNMGQVFDQEKATKEHDPLARVRGTGAKGKSTAIKTVDGEIQKTNKRLLRASNAIGAIKRNKHVHIFELQGLPDKVILEICRDLLKVQEIPTEVEELIVRKANGIPYFAVSITNYMLEVEAISVERDDDGTNVVEINGDFDQEIVPDNLKRMLISKIDNLDMLDKNLLKTASVFGNEFNFNQLTSVLPQDLELEYLTSLLSLIENNYISRRVVVQNVQGGGADGNEDEDGEFELEVFYFHEPLIRDVAYEMMSIFQKKKLHNQIGELIEQEIELIHEMEAGPLISTAMDHFVRGENWQKAIRYGELAASNALNDGNSIEAGLIYQELKDLSSKHPAFRRIVDPNSYTTWLEHAQLADDEQAFNKAFKPLRRLTRAAGGSVGSDNGRSSLHMSGGLPKVSTGRKSTVVKLTTGGVSTGPVSPKRRMSMMEAISGGINSIFRSDGAPSKGEGSKSGGRPSGQRRTSASILGFDLLGVASVKEHAPIDPLEALSARSARIPRAPRLEGSGDRALFSTVSGQRLHIV